MQNFAIKLILFSLVLPFSNNPPNASTGAPNEENCRNCHTSYPLNSGDGIIEILGVPESVIAGETYTLQVKVSHPILTKWGFEVSAKTSNNTQAGLLEITDSTYTLSGSQDGITYIKHRTAGTYVGQSESAIWQMVWVAPDTIHTDIYFYASGVAANNAYGNSGDYVYTTSLSITESEEITDIDFETEIQPIFNANCTIYCHTNGGSYTGGLDLTSYDNIMEGGSNHGPVIIAGDADGSLLIQVLEGTSSIVPQMPSGGPSLSYTQMQFIRTWINELEVSYCAVGDFNEDGATNILDIVQIVNFILGSGAGDEFCGDANEDGTLNILDVVLIVNIILGD